MIWVRDAHTLQPHRLFGYIAPFEFIMNREPHINRHSTAMHGGISTLLLLFNLTWHSLYLTLSILLPCVLVCFFFLLCLGMCFMFVCQSILVASEPLQLIQLNAIFHVVNLIVNLIGCFNLTSLLIIFLVHLIKISNYSYFCHFVVVGFSSGILFQWYTQFRLLFVSSLGNERLVFILRLICHFEMLSNKHLIQFDTIHLDGFSSLVFVYVLSFLFHPLTIFINTVFFMFSVFSVFDSLFLNVFLFVCYFIELITVVFVILCFVCSSTCVNYPII